MSTATQLKVLHIAFIKNKLNDAQNARQLAQDFWTWFGEQKLSDFISLDMLHKFAEERVLSHGISELARSDIRLIVQAAIDHPINSGTKLEALLNDAQVAQLAAYIGAQKTQREVLIHEVIGNSGFAAMLSQTISHAITDYLDNSLGKVAGVGKLMKFGKGALEKATNSNLDDGLGSYLNKNITNLTAKTEAIAKRHLDDARIEGIILDAWQAVKSKPVSEIKQYLDDESVAHGEQLAFDVYNHIRQTSFLHTHVRDHIATWYDAHKVDGFNTLFDALHLDNSVVTDIVDDVIAPILTAVSQSTWFTDWLHEQLDEFYASEAVVELLG